MQNNQPKDTLYKDQREALHPFRFNRQVAEVFDDMIRRSVPGYERIIEQLAHLAKAVVTPNSRVYDLGSSLGAASLAIRESVAFNDYQIFAVDNSSAMLERSKALMQTSDSEVVVTHIEDDIQHIDIVNASLVVMNFTLQFIPPVERDALINRIYQGMNPNGAFVLSEKIAFDDPKMEQLLRTLHESFKRSQGYSELEISQKREALQNVMIPESLNTHQKRLKAAGFKSIEVWFQEYNFISILAIK